MSATKDSAIRCACWVGIFMCRRWASSWWGLCPDLCTFCPDLCTLCLRCYPSINQHKYSPCTHGGGHWLQLALAAFFPSAIDANISCNRWWCHSLQLVLVVFSIPPTCTHTPLAFEQLGLCGDCPWWCW